MVIDMLNYGENLKIQRKQYGISQLELAKRTGISQQNINRWEKGTVIPNIDFCVKLADFYGISLDELVGRYFKEDNKTTYSINFRDNNGTINNNFK